MKETFVIGSAIDFAFDFQDMDFTDLDTIEAVIIQQQTPVLTYSKAAGDIVSGLETTFGYLTIPAADTEGLTCGDFEVQLTYVYNGGEPYKNIVIGGTMRNGY